MQGFKTERKRRRRSLYLGAFSSPAMASHSLNRNIVSEEKVRKAVKALLKWRKLHPKTPQNQNPTNLEDEDEDEAKEAGFDGEYGYDNTDDDGFLYLLLTLKKIPPKDFSKIPHKILLPRPLNSLAEGSLNLCLIIDDRPIKSPFRITSEAAQKRIKSEGIPITKVLKLSKLKSEYNSFEARRKLCNSFDVFFADRRVYPLLPKYLGKQFYKKKRRLPVPLDLRRSDTTWKEQIENACNSSLLSFGSGTCNALRIGRCGLNNLMGSEEIIENVFAAIGGIVEIVPKKWNGIRALHLKLSDSLALPIFEAIPDQKLSTEDCGSKEILGDNKIKKGNK